MSLNGPALSLEGVVESGFDVSNVVADGDVDANFVNQWLEPYNISLTGGFTLEQAALRLVGQTPVGADGEVRWNGGPVRYILSGNLSNKVLPGMRAELGPGPEATVYPVAPAGADGTPVLQARILDNGFAKIGVTRYMTEILGTPWPGSEPDHAVVLEVEEQLF